MKVVVVGALEQVDGAEPARAREALDVTEYRGDCRVAARRREARVRRVVRRRTALRRPALRRAFRRCPTTTNTHARRR